MAHWRSNIPARSRRTQHEQEKVDKVTREALQALAISGTILLSIYIIFWLFR